MNSVRPASTASARFIPRKRSGKKSIWPGFSFVLETDGYTSFSGSWYGPVIRGFDTSDYRFGHATHGHHPDRGPLPTLIAFGPSIKEGAVLKNCRLVDEAPTFAAALGFTMGRDRRKSAS